MDNNYNMYTFNSLNKLYRYIHLFKYIEYYLIISIISYKQIKILIIINSLYVTWFIIINTYYINYQ